MNGTAKQAQYPPNPGTQSERDHLEFLTILKQVFDQGQNCAPCQECDKTVKGRLQAAEIKLQQKQKNCEDLAKGKL